MGIGTGKTTRTSVAVPPAYLCQFLGDVLLILARYPHRFFLGDPRRSPFLRQLRCGTPPLTLSLYL